jgi:DNA-binding NarL/FixJ family response regulator
LLDISMPVLNGFEAAREIAQLSPATKIIFLTGHALGEYARQAFRVGGVGFVSKKQAVRDLTKAVKAALERQTYISGDAVA